MRRVVFILFLLMSSLFSSEITWANSFDEALKQAKKEQKRVLFLVHKPKCPCCEKFESEILPNPEVQKIISKNYILAKALNKDGTYSVKEFSILGSFTLFFVNSDGKKYRYPVVQYMEPKQFINELKKGLM